MSLRRYQYRVRVNWMRLSRHIVTMVIIGLNAPWWVTVLAFTLTLNLEFNHDA